MGSASPVSMIRPIKRHDVQAAEALEGYAMFTTTTGKLESEDCLTINFQRPLYRDKLLPVMFFIHGGESSWGAGLPDTLVDHFVLVRFF